MFTAVGPPSSLKFVPDMPPLLCLENPDLCHPPTADPRSINFPARSERRVRHRRNVVFFCLLFMKSRNCLSRRKKVSPNRREKGKRDKAGGSRDHRHREREKKKGFFAPTGDSHNDAPRTFVPLLNQLFRPRISRTKENISIYFPCGGFYAA